MMLFAVRRGPGADLPTQTRFEAILDRAEAEAAAQNALAKWLRGLAGDL